MRPVLRNPSAAVLIHRVATGTGLAEIRTLETRLDTVAGALAENDALAEPLADQVTRLEQALVPVLRRRARSEARERSTDA